MGNKTLYIMVGLSGAGKSEFVKQHLLKGQEWWYVSRDEIRFSLLKEEDNYFAKEDEVYQKFIKDIIKGIKNRDIYYIIADATHISWGARNKLLTNLKNNVDIDKLDIIPIMMNTDVAECLRRNAQREGRACVPDKVIRTMAKALTDPVTDPFKYTAIMYVNSGTQYVEKPKFMYRKSDIKIKEIPLKDVIKHD